MLGASAGRWFGWARRTCVDSCKVGPAMLADGTGGNGRTEPSVAWEKPGTGAVATRPEHKGGP